MTRSDRIEGYMREVFVNEEGLLILKYTNQVAPMAYLNSLRYIMEFDYKASVKKRNSNRNKVKFSLWERKVVDQL